ncbi:winged helix-turn-helix transcriptional regulator [Legionella spiritensis]|uniref:Putative transcriptional regulator n=1 Tax=Legionella spiritensis TaxID=452 RepID=A0A0W0Z625_LEGSP|nr:helix-turn-helix domain-containing protein [Legionella spiritensis]KTD64569.1 putative transcriptional regulator [Legionella spiritensis]SNV29682.1 putative transcriptional regulator [Legionella spiritensis]
MIYDVYQEQCPSRIVLEIISDKWVILIIQLLAEKSHRFGELRRSIGGITAKVLSSLLKKLESYGLVIREDKSGLILHVEYSLTLLGISLNKVCQSITQWAESHIDELSLVRADDKF